MMTETLSSQLAAFRAPHSERVSKEIKFSRGPSLGNGPEKPKDPRKSSFLEFLKSLSLVKSFSHIHAMIAFLTGQRYQ